MNNNAVRLDRDRHAINLRGQTRPLQEKTWQVVKMLADSYPDTVSRVQLIDRIWHGNVAVGEKGLNQAIWQLRRTLEDSARQPRIIRTIPRVGYRWILPPGDRGTAPRQVWVARNARRLAAAACALGIAVTALLIADSRVAPSSIGTVTNPATEAYLVGRDIHVVFKDGTVGKLINSNRADVRSPVLSRDGTEVAIPVREDGGCRMVTFELATRERKDFGECPVT